MTLQELFSYIESVEFKANIGILSGLSSVKWTLENDVKLAQLIGELRSSKEKARQALERFVDLLRINDQSKFRHSYDIALTGYLYVLSCVDTAAVMLAIDSMEETSNLWWARRLANELLQSRQSTSSESLVFKIIESKIKIHTETKQTTFDYGSGLRSLRDADVSTMYASDPSVARTEKKYGEHTFARKERAG